MYTRAPTHELLGPIPADLLDPVANLGPEARENDGIFQSDTAVEKFPIFFFKPIARLDFPVEQTIVHPYQDDLSAFNN